MSIEPLTHAEATDFFAALYCGKHHIPGRHCGGGENVRAHGYGWSVSHFGTLSSFDFDKLTRLVLLAHERCIRVEVDSGGPRRVRIAIWRRQREGGFSERHPTIEQAIAAFRGVDP